MIDELRHEIRRVTIGNAWVSDATLAVIVGELDSGERVVAALTTAGGGNALVATNRRVIVATKRKIAYECPYDALTEVEAKAGFLTRGVRLRSAKRTYLYNYKELDKEGPVEMAAAIRLLLDGSAPDDDNDDEDATEIAVVGEGASALAQLASAYIGVATPSRAEIAALPGLLAEGEQVALITNCRRGRDYGALAATDARALFVSEGEDGVVAAESWPHSGTERVEIGVARSSLAYVQVHTADRVVQIDALDIVAAESWQQDLIERVQQCIWGDIRSGESSVEYAMRVTSGYIQLHTAVGVVQINPFHDIEAVKSWQQDLIERVEQDMVRGSLGYIQLYTTDGVVQIDALDLDCARQAAEFLQSKAGVAAGWAAQHELADVDNGEDAPTAELADQRELEDADKGEGALTGEQAAGMDDGAGDDGGAASGAGENQGALTDERTTQLQSIETLRDSGILTAEEYEQMRARIYERESERATQLQSIEALRDSGILTAEEYERMRARIYETG